MGEKQRFYVDISALHNAVTGSCIVNTVKYPDGTTEKFLVDFGLFQEHNEKEGINEFIPFNAEEISFCLITHNHIDHTGRLPFLYKKGFKGKIYTSIPTSILIPNAIADSSHIISKSAKLLKKAPLYTLDDSENVQQLITSEKYEESFFPNVNKHIMVTFFPNGHLIGASIILVQVRFPGYDDINILFTGDYNNKNMFFDVKHIPNWVKELNLTVICESTYGTMDTSDMKQVFMENVTKALSQGKNIIVPVFSLGRSQEILYTIRKAQDECIINPNTLVYLDGELAINYTEIYKHYDSLGIRPNMIDFVPKENIFKYLNKSTRTEVLTEPRQKIILTTSGMATYGPAQFYLTKYLSDPNTLIHFSGYVAEGTLGRRLKDTQLGESIMINGLMLKKLADVEYTSEFSAHAKSDELINFLKQFEKLNFVLINHGEPDVKEIFAKKVLDEVSPKNIGILNRDYVFRINAFGYSKSFSAKFLF